MAAPTLTTGSLAAHLSEKLASQGGVQLVGPADIPITHIDALDRAGEGAITFVRDSRFAARWALGKAACVLATRDVKLAGHDPATRAVIFVPDADLALNFVLELFAPPAPAPVPGVHPTAIVDPGAQLGRGVSVGPHCILGPGACVGDGSRLVSGVFLGRDVRVGRACVLHHNVTILDRCVVGDGCQLFPGVVIGGDGFGYRPDPSGRGVIKIPHIGNVEIGAGVEIGANTCIDRAKFGSTIIGDGAKIDNLVQIGHGCRIGRCALLAGQVGLAGSVTVGDGAQLGGQVGVGDGLSVEAGTRLAGQSGVTGHIPRGTYIGTPPVPVREWFRMHATLRRLATREARAQPPGESAQ